jgi:phage gp29-like protein
MGIISGIKGLFAEPRVTRPIMNEIATTRDGRDITRGYLMPDMPLWNESQLDDAKLELILQDDQVKVVTEQRINAVIGAEWQVDAGGNKRADKKAADFVRESLQSLGSSIDSQFVKPSGMSGFDGVTQKMWWGIFHGLAVAECLWARDGSNIIVDAIKVRDRKRFIFDSDFRLRLLTNYTANGELLPARKFWVFNSGATHDDDPYGIGLAHWLYWPVYFKKQYQRFGAIHLEKFASPTVTGKYPADLDLAVTDEDIAHANAVKAQLLAAVKAVQLDSGIIFPEGMELAMLEASRSGSADYLEHYQAMQEVIAKVGLGQSASTEGTSGKLGNEELRSEVRTEIIKADADLICGSFNNSVVRWLTEWNFSGAALPRVWRVLEAGEDLGVRAERDSKIFSFSGVTPSLDYLAEVYGEEYGKLEPKPEPEPVPEPVPVPEPAPEPVAPDELPEKDDDDAEFSEASENETQRAIDALVEKTGAILEPLFEKSSISPIKKILNNSSDFNEFLDKLDNLFPGMNKADRADAIRDALLVSKLAGIVAVKNGD